MARTSTFSPVSAHRTRLFVPIARNFNVDGPVEERIGRRFARARARTILLDYDGTLREFEAHPDLASPTPEIRAKFIEMVDAVLAPYVRDRGLRWEYHIDETSYELWSIHGYRPPLPGTEDEKRWRAENRPSPVGPREVTA